MKVIYSGRNNYVNKNGYLTDQLSLQRVFFQGCQITPYLFMFVIEIMALFIGENENINGISVKKQQA